MPWRDGERPRKSWTNCAACWTRTRGKADEQPSELDFAGDSANARLDVAALPVARRGTGGVVCGGVGDLPERVGALCAGGRCAGIDAGVTGNHFYVAAYASEFGRYDRGGRSHDVDGDLHTTRDRAVR